MNNKWIKHITFAALFVFSLFAVNFMGPGSQALAQQNNGDPRSLGGSLQSETQPGQQKTVISAKEAFAQVSKEAEKGNVEAMSALATLYEKGIGTPRNLTKAVDWHHKAAVANHPPSIYQLGLAYEIGKGVTANRDTAIKNFRRAAELKVPEAHYKLASLAMAGPAPKADDKKALEHLKNAGLTSGKALEAIGNFYENGVGLAPNYTEAFKWYQKAANSGLVDAMYRLGFCYETGIGTPVNPKEALATYQKAVDNKSGASAYKLAGMYMAGSLVPVDHALALKHMRVAVELGYSDAANELGVIYLQGLLGLEANSEQALQMFLKSAELGNAESMKNMAVIYRSGIGLASDPAKALTWYLIAQKSGYQPENIKQIIAELTQELKPEQLSASAAEAEQWFKARQEAAAGPANN